MEDKSYLLEPVERADLGRILLSWGFPSTEQLVPRHLGAAGVPQLYLVESRTHFRSEY